MAMCTIWARSSERKPFTTFSRCQSVKKEVQLSIKWKLSRKYQFGLAGVENQNFLLHFQLLTLAKATEPKAPAYFHSFSMTENHWLFLEMPYRYNLFKMLFRNKSTTAPADTLLYKDEAYSMFRHVNKKSGKVLDLKINTKGMGVFHFGNAFEVEADGVTFVVWDQCPNYFSNGSTHLFNIDTLRSSVEDIRKAFKEAGRNEAMRFVYPINVPESAKPGDNLNAKLKGVFNTTGTAILQEDGSILVEPEGLLSEEDKKRG